MAVDTAQPPQRRRSPWKVLLLVLAAVAVLLGVGALGYFIADSQGSSETETAADGSADEDVTETTVDDQVEEVVTAEDADAGTGETASDETITDAEADAGEDDQPVSDDADQTADGDPDTAADGETATDPDESGRQAFFRGGKVYLTGPVPSEEVGKLIEEKAAAVVGPDNVVNEYVIDPTATIPEGDSAPLYVEDVVLFEFNSISVSEPFFPILDLGTLLLRQNPQSTITVVTRTDAVGSEEVNLDVATKRAQAVINYWLSKGVSADQIIADPRGEEGASEDDDEETAALNRRAEFVITGLLD